jgi:hypothetical protein
VVWFATIRPPACRQRGTAAATGRYAVCLAKAAHKTARKIELLKYEYTKPRANRTELTVRMEYHGAVSGKRYVADIVFKIDSSNKDAWEVLNIDYTDNNSTVPHNEKKIQELIKQMNK